MFRTFRLLEVENSSSFNCFETSIKSGTAVSFRFSNYINDYFKKNVYYVIYKNLIFWYVITNITLTFKPNGDTCLFKCIGTAPFFNLNVFKQIQELYHIKQL